MEVILMEKIASLGNLGDVVKVKNGFARNFLIPTGRAKRATEAAKAEFATRRAELEASAAAKLAECQGRAAGMSGLTVKITQMAGVDGKLFGSVTNADIAAALAKEGHTVERSQIRMPQGHIKQTGDYPVEVVLHADVVAPITVSVQPEA